MSSTADHELPPPDLWRPRLPYNPEYDSDSLRVVNLSSDEVELKERVLQQARGSLAMRAVRQKFYRTGDLFTMNHCEQTAELATALAIRRGMDDPAGLIFIAEVALAHDVGKCHPDIQPLTHIAGEFTPEQRLGMQPHTRHGALTAAKAGFGGNHQLAIYGHHSRQRGAYPADVDLRGERDAAGFRPDLIYIVDSFAVVDEYEAFTTARSYKPKLPRNDALAAVDHTFTGSARAVEALVALTDPGQARQQSHAA